MMKRKLSILAISLGMITFASGGCGFGNWSRLVGDLAGYWAVTGAADLLPAISGDKK